MDPYARIRVGHFVYETQTDPNGGKTPRWNRVIHSQLPSGVNTIFVEIYDECSFKMDELIAWTEIKIPESVLRGETHEEWYSLSGKQGDHVEGMIDVVMSFTVSQTVSKTHIYCVISIIYSFCIASFKYAHNFFITFITISFASFQNQFFSEIPIKITLFSFSHFSPKACLCNGQL